nr:AraC family ligand binding domain-containing protein [Streptococcus gallolyticus]
MHQNTAFELLYVLSGTVINKIEDKEFIYHAGQGCLLNRRITHSDILKMVIF